MNAGLDELPVCYYDGGMDQPANQDRANRETELTVRENLGPTMWKHGTSGNPSGRRPFPYDLLLKETKNGALVVETVVAACKDAPRYTDRLTAAEWIANRLWGPVRQLADVTVYDVDAILAGIQARAAGAMAPVLGAEGETVEGEARAIEPEGST